MAGYSSTPLMERGFGKPPGLGKGWTSVGVAIWLGSLRMINGYYQSGPERSGKVRRLFDAIAPRYDLINDVQSAGLHRLWKRRLVQQLACRPGETALDLCCGTGDVTFLLRRSGVRTIGVDFSLRMLCVADSRQTSERGQGLFVVGDGMRLPLADGCVDLVTISYGLRNLPDFGEALEEMYRVTRPGGRLGILDFGKPRLRFWRGVYFGYLRLMVPCYGWLLCGDAAAYSYILESLRHYPEAGGVSELLRQAGWSEVVVHELWGGVMGLHLARKAPGS